MGVAPPSIQLAALQKEEEEEEEEGGVILRVHRDIPRSLNQGPELPATMAQRVS